MVLAFFVTCTAKPRVVYDGAAELNSMSINQAVLAGENLMNGSVDVLIRFRFGRYTCVAAISNFFFQVKFPCRGGQSAIRSAKRNLRNCGSCVAF